MDKKDIEVDEIDLSRGKYELPMVCIYDRPKDFPDKIVARLWDGEKPTRIIMLADTIEEMRARRPKNMITVAAMSEEDPVIVETWI